MTTYILLEQKDIEVVNNFNTNGYYIAVITTTIKGDAITEETLHLQGYEPLIEPLKDCVRVDIEDEPII
jgi:hypothetical protein